MPNAVLLLLDITLSLVFVGLCVMPSRVTESIKR